MTLNLDRSTWTRVKFGDVTRKVNAKVDPASGEVDRYIAGEHMDTDELRISRWGTVGDGYLGPAFHARFRPGQVLYGSRRTYLRKVALADFDGVCANTTFVIETKDPNVLLPELLPFVMTTESFHAHSKAESKGSVNPYVNWPDIAKYEFSLPPLDEQNRIAELLWAAIDRRQKTQGVLAALTTCAEIDFARALESSSGPVLPVARLLAENPKNGLSLPASDGQGGLPTLSLGAVRNGRIESEGNIKYVSVDEASVTPYTMEAGDFFVVRGNGNRDLVARAALLRTGDVPAGCFYPDLLIRLRFKADVIDPEFALAQWNDADSQNRLLMVAKSSNGTYKVNGGDVKAHEMKVPPLPAQQEIMRRVSQHTAAREACLEELRAIDLLAQQLRAELLEVQR